MSGEELHAITIAELAIHNHGGATAGGTSGGQSVDHSHSGTTAGVGDHTHPMSQQILGYPSGTQASNNILFIIGAGGLYNTGASMTPAGAHSHSFSTGGASTGHTHSVPALAISSQGSGTAHNTMQPYVVKNKLIRIA
jgi:hypothetical protein